MRKIKTLLLGGTGMAGHAISLYFLEQGHDLTVFSRTPFRFSKNITGSAENLNQLKLVVLNLKHQ